MDKEKRLERVVSSKLTSIIRKILGYYGKMSNDVHDVLSNHRIEWENKIKLPDVILRYIEYEINKFKKYYPRHSSLKKVAFIVVSRL